MTFCSFLAFGNVEEVFPTEQWIMDLFSGLGGLKGASTLAIVALIVQLIMKFFKTPLANFAGKYRLIVVSGLTVIGGMVGLVAQGSTWLSALVSASVIAAIQVFFHQIVTQYKKKD